MTRLDLATSTGSATTVHPREIGAHRFPFAKYVSGCPRSRFYRRVHSRLATLGVGHGVSTTRSVLGSILVHALIIVAIAAIIALCRMKYDPRQNRLRESH